MNLRELQYVVALADHGNFARAAAACYVSQPTLSTQLKKLEQYLGVQLFERTKKRVLPTAAGKEIITQARVVLADIERLKALARGAVDPFAGDVQLGVIPTLGPYLLPHVLRNLRSTYPRLRLYVRELQTALLLQELRDGKLDLVLLALPIEARGLCVQPLFHEPFLLALPPGHPLARRTRVRQAELAGERLLLLEEGHCLRDQALALCGARGAAEDEGLRATSLETLRQMVASGVGTTLMPALAAEAGRMDKRLLVFRAFAAPAPRRTIGAAWRQGFARETVARALADLIRRYAPAGVVPAKQAQ